MSWYDKKIKQSKRHNEDWKRERKRQNGGRREERKETERLLVTSLRTVEKNLKS